MKQKPQTISEQNLHKGWLEVNSRQIQVPDRAEPYNYEIVKVGDGCGVGVLPFLDKNTVLLSRQYRPPIDEVILELIQGGRRNGERKAEAIKRELLEETGMKGNIEYLTAIYPLPGTLEMRFDIFKATHLTKVQEPQADPLEDAELIEYPYTQVVREVIEGKHRDSVLVTAVLYHEAINRKWKP